MQPLSLRRREAGTLRGGEHLHPVLRRVLAARGIRDAAEIEHRLAHLAAPAQLGGIKSACVLLADALRHQRRICVVGDFDCDGATGTAVAVRGLRLLGARHVDYRVPHRAVHGYGLSKALVLELVESRPDLIITVDNGISSLAGVATARELGMDVLVTDHHLPGANLPVANAIVNPNLEGDGFPSKAMAGVGVMFCVLLALRAHLREGGYFAELGQAEPDLAVLLDLVALGTVADLVPLDFNNRILVEAGLRRMRTHRACAGIKALIETSGRDAERVIASDLGYALGPRINAAGRLEDMRLGIECLLTDDPQQAREWAGRLSAINLERRDLQEQMVAQAEASVACWLAAYGQARDLPKGVVLHDEGWHPGVVGLVASRLKDRLHRPVIACAPAAEGSDELRGSARSIRGVHVRDLLAEIDARHPGLILRFGGHAMAAGLSLPRAALPEFVARFDAIVAERTPESCFEAVLVSDGSLAAEDFDLGLAQVLREAMPWGQGIPEPLFDDVFDLVDWRIVGERHWRLRLRREGLAQPVEAMLFNAEAGRKPPERLRAAYQLDINDWNGRQSLRLILRHLEPA